MLVTLDDNVPMAVQVVYRPGLVSRKENNFVKDSADAIVVFVEDDVSKRALLPNFRAYVLTFVVSLS